MWKLLFYLVILHAVHCVCRSDFELTCNGECRGLYASEVTAADKDGTEMAIKMCKEIQGQPVIIHNDYDHTYWDNQAAKTREAFYPMGLICNTSSTKWMWADGSDLDYKPTKYSNELDGACKTGCGWYGWSSTHEWNLYCTTGGGSKNIFCSTQSQVPLPHTDGCEGFDDDSEDGVCYQVGETAESWQDAQLMCAKLGANLASVHNQQENSFIRRLAVSKGAVNGVFLGATTSGKGNEFGWIDGSDWDYSNFHSGFPIPGIGDCVAMDTSSSSGLWMNIECTSALPVACIRNYKSIAAPEPTCSDGPWKENVLITSPGFPFNASLPCDFFLIVDAGKRVQTEIVFLEANPCSDFLVIHDDFLGGPVIANITGEVRNITYTTSSNLMRVNWEPNGGINVMGMAMTFRGV